MTAWVLGLGLALGCSSGTEVPVESGDTGTDGDASTGCAAPSAQCGEACVDVATDRGHCGGCGKACGAGEVCVDAKCQIACPKDQSVCGGKCVSTSEDRAHCGKCDTACADGELCVAGKCTVACPKGQTACDGKCATLESDNANCGKCDTKCGPGQVCSASTCGTTCATGFLTCDGPVLGDAGTTKYCANPKTDRDNCGACGTKCLAGEICDGGSCKLECPTGQTVCGGKCVTLESDAANCGACGTACPAGHVCSGGKCAVSCGAPFSTCGADPRYCANLANDESNCGSCGTACATGETCSVGKCGVSCVAGTTLCSDGKCHDLSTDNANCGACSTGTSSKACAPGTVCSAGSCSVTCVGGTTLCGDGRCHDLLTDNSNCGGCSTTSISRACGAGTVCSGGVCGASCGAGLTSCGGKCVDTAHDPANCGGCSLVCPSLPNAMMVCAAPACYAICKTGFADCDGVSTNGCEANLATDANHCGVCGSRCGGVCTGGTCACMALSVPAGAYARSTTVATVLSRTGAACYEAWAKINPVAPTDAIYLSSTAAGADSNFIMRCFGGLNKIAFAVQSGSFIEASYPVNCDDGLFHHVAGCRVVSGSTATLTLYWDGALVGTASGPAAYVGTPAPVYVGGVTYGQDGLAGVIDEIRISSTLRYSGPFTPQRRFATDSSTVALWHLDEGVGTSSADASGAGHTLTLSSTSWTPACLP
ncbi:MAG: hypothetical protein HYV09_02725 [Deltaproteobacteria bacterium]|nr:hypothetical protein [Deltaproteobacteria bacterium]